MSRSSSSLRAMLAGLRENSSGATAVEFALVIPIFLVIVLGTINFGMAMSAVTQLHYAAERSARCLSVNVTTPCSKANIDAYAKGIYAGPGLNGLTFSSPTTDPVCGRQVNGSGSYTILTGFKKSAITFSATACYPVI
jgi:Flp pilus assembly protein TadG